MVKLQMFKNGQLMLTIPKTIAAAKGWKKGIELEFVIDNVGNLLLRPKQA